MNIYFYGTRPFEVQFFQNCNSANHQLFFSKSKLSEATIDEAKGCEVVCINSLDDANEKVINLLAKNGCKLIVTRTSGFDHIDINAARQLNIRIANIPSYSPEAIAEHAVALLLCISRKIIQSHSRVMQANFSLEDLMGFNLSDKTIGVIGTGNIGKAFIRILIGFGSKIIAYDQVEDLELCTNFGVEYMDFESVLSRADVISLHVPLNSQTEKLIDKCAFEIMKDETVIINTSRGGVIDTKELITNLNSGKIRAAGLDVYDNEQPYFYKDCSAMDIEDNLSELINLKNVILTGHHAFFTDTAIKSIAKISFEIINCFEKSKDHTAFL